MPFIDCKLSKKLNDAEKENLKSELGKAITILHKPESYLMVGISDGYDLYFAGKKLSNGAYLSVSLYGEVPPSCSKMTKELCDILDRDLGISPDDVYITYHGVDDWGWSSSNF